MSSQYLAHRELAAALASRGDLRGSVDSLEHAVSTPDAPLADAEALRWLAAGQRLLTGHPAPLAGLEPDGIATLDDYARCAAAQTCVLIAAAEGRYGHALDHARTAVRCFDPRTMPRMGFLIPDIWLGTAHLWNDDFGEAIRSYEAVGLQAARRGEVVLLVQAIAGCGGIHFLAGRWTEALKDIEYGLAVANETGANAHLVLGSALLALIALARGHLPAAREHIVAGHEQSTAGFHLFGVDLLMWAHAVLLEADGDPAGALTVLSSLWAQIAPLRGLLQYRNIAPDLVRLAVRHGDNALASAVTADVELLANQSTTSGAIAAAHRCRGLAGSDPETLAMAVAAYRPTPRRIELAAACEELADLLITARRIDDAVPYLDEAAAIHLACGANARLARIDATLRAYGRRRRRAPRSPVRYGWGALSPREREIVQLVARGLSNPQIGERLFISRRTVETHIAHIFHKLGVANRVQLAAVAARPASRRPALAPVLEDLPLAVQHRQRHEDDSLNSEEETRYAEPDHLGRAPRREHGDRQDYD